MEQNISYQNWPALPRIVTAFKWNKLEVKNHKVPLYLGWACVVLGFLIADYEMNWRNFIGPVCMIAIGVANIINARGIKWINLHSTWEERYSHKSSTSDKIVYILVSVLLIICLYGIFKYSHLLNL